jgi:hypothetical protein
MKKQSRYTNRAKAFTPQQKFGPAISEAAEPRCDTPSATKLSHTPRSLRRRLARILERQKMLQIGQRA